MRHKDPELLLLVVGLAGRFDDTVANCGDDLLKIDEDAAWDGEAFENRHQDSDVEVELLDAYVLFQSLIECFGKPVCVSALRRSPTPMSPTTGLVSTNSQRLRCDTFRT